MRSTRWVHRSPSLVNSSCYEESGCVVPIVYIYVVQRSLDQAAGGHWQISRLPALLSYLVWQSLTAEGWRAGNWQSTLFFLQHGEIVICYRYKKNVFILLCQLDWTLDHFFFIDVRKCRRLHSTCQVAITHYCKKSVLFQGQIRSAGVPPFYNAPCTRHGVQQDWNEMPFNILAKIRNFLEFGKILRNFVFAKAKFFSMTENFSLKT